jgi:hypothetical protein
MKDKVRNIICDDEYKKKEKLNIHSLKEQGQRYSN